MTTRSLPGLGLTAVVAAACGAAVAVLLTPEREPDAASELMERVARLEAGRAPHDVTRERASSPRLDDIDARLRSLEAWAAERAAGDGPAAPDAASTDAAEDTRLREELSVRLATPAGSQEHASALDDVAAYLVESAGPPRDETALAWARRALLRQAARDRITPDDAERLDAVLSRLPSGHPARTPLAQAVAIGWSADPRMDAFLQRHAVNTEPGLHQGVLAILDDEHPSDAFSEYVIRIVRDERDPSVLGIALGLDRIESAATASVAPRLVAAIADRIESGDLDADLRGRAGLAVAVAGLRAREPGVTTLRRLAERETDADLAERLRAAADQLARGEATLKSLERLLR